MGRQEAVLSGEGIAVSRAFGELVHPVGHGFAGGTVVDGAVAEHEGLQFGARGRGVRRRAGIGVRRRVGIGCGVRIGIRRGIRIGDRVGIGRRLAAGQLGDRDGGAVGEFELLDADQEVGAVGAHKLVAVTRDPGGVVGERPVELQHVEAGAAMDAVIAGTRREDVVARAAGQIVLLGGADHHVRAVGPAAADTVQEGAVLAGLAPPVADRGVLIEQVVGARIAVVDRAQEPPRAVLADVADIDELHERPVAAVLPHRPEVLVERDHLFGADVVGEEVQQDLLLGLGDAVDRVVDVLTALVADQVQAVAVDQLLLGGQRVRQADQGILHGVIGAQQVGQPVHGIDIGVGDGRQQLRAQLVAGDRDAEIGRDREGVEDIGRAHRGVGLVLEPVGRFQVLLGQPRRVGQPGQHLDQAGVGLGSIDLVQDLGHVDGLLDVVAAPAVGAPLVAAHLVQVVGVLEAVVPRLVRELERRLEPRVEVVAHIGRELADVLVGRQVRDVEPRIGADLVGQLDHDLDRHAVVFEPARMLGADALVPVGAGRAVDVLPVHEADLAHVLDDIQPVRVEHGTRLVEIVVLLGDDRDVADVVAGAGRVRRQDVQAKVRTVVAEHDPARLRAQHRDAATGQVENALALVVQHVDPGMRVGRLEIGPREERADQTAARRDLGRPAVRVQIPARNQVLVRIPVREERTARLHLVQERHLRRPVDDPLQTKRQRRVVKTRRT